MISKIVHYAADAVLVSAVLAGIKRSTIESNDVRGYVDQYLSVGEWVVDQGSAFMAASTYFERKR
ncbi:hypothetical protein CPC16_006413 [Podila verticillata]|nr:hypothetical protein CPC16_006413 [Podila verticillata]